ncbi:MAG: T9SS type A sorting domain-containing protein, partial [Flavobacteriales bacterium]|nr:T9SS type A sorting domain-containing protein [Flavobacteriales bacterium]
FEPLILQMGDVMETTVDLTAGWNWISLPFDHPDHTNDGGWTEWSVGDVLGDIAADVEVAKSTGQAWVSSYDADSEEWAGSASTPMALNHTYQVKLSADASVVWTGRMPDNIDSTSFEVAMGWNDLGFPSQRALAVEEALRSLYDAEVLEVNDEVKGRYDGFATYLGNGEWAGTLDRLEPTRGYRIYLQGDGNALAGDSLGTLVLPESTLFLGSPTLRAEEAISGLPNALAENVRGLPYSMEAIAELAMPAHWVRSPEDRIEWWNRGILMASARPQVLDQGERYFVQGYGLEAADDIEVRFISGANGMAYVSDDKVRFEANDRLGTLNQPVTWRFTEAGAEPVLSELAIVPNPFNAGFEVVYSGTETLQYLSLVDTRGRTIEVRRGSQGTRRYAWQTQNLQSGMYFVRIETISGAVHRIPVVKQ